MSPGLELAGIGVRFGGLTALDDVSLTVPPGRIVGVIGPNGAGKTTVFNVICGFVAPHTGTLSLGGRPLRPKPHRLARAGIARTLQGVGLFAGLTLAENVMTGARARAGFVSSLLGAPWAARDERRLRTEALALLDSLDIARHADALPATLPYAIQKKAGLARALAARPRLLLLDEPAGGLGAEEIDELAALIRDLPSSAGTAVLLVEHHMDLVMSVCDEIVVLDFGRVVATGTPDRVRGEPAVAAAYLGTEAITPDGAALAPRDTRLAATGPADAAAGGATTRDATAGSATAGSATAGSATAGGTTAGDATTGGALVDGATADGAAAGGAAAGGRPPDPPPGGSGDGVVAIR
ncbi:MULTISPECIES: ABC transporter ATP-binding protein [Catenuloplanes]|uniref:Branched-chain amino acid transport system ATP-binding protein n=1 Tax=Catenuloplanes niger TaxID=587534 RepID=A0AAE3ZUQ3_9ACTN|nr:ABC transporter ATP-binding protein [Catenuloplanes niger]MDR7326434.1 branched-chain amino acid transport system ATP-binding protein [Catenuloplanes niger]